MHSSSNTALSFASGLRSLGVALTLLAIATLATTGCGGSGTTGGHVQTTPTITWPTPAAITAGTALSSTQLDATASVAGSFVYTPAAGTVPAVGTQTLSVTFTPTDTTDYTSASATVQIVVNAVVKTTPTITWPTPAAITAGTALSSTQLDATASVAGTFVYTPAAGTVPAVGTDTLSVTFTPTDTTDYTSASATVQIVVNAVVKTNPTITWPTPAAITAGTALSSTQLDATASVAGTFVYTPAAGTVPAVGTDTLLATFTPTDTTDYNSVTANVTLTVIPATPTITSITPRYVVADTFSYFVNYTVTGTGFQNGDNVHDESGMFTPDISLAGLASGATSFGLTLQWQPGSYEPWFSNWEVQHPSGAYGNSSATAFFGSGSQSTLADSASTGTMFQVEEKTGQVHLFKTDGTTGILFPITQTATPTAIAIDDTTGDIAYLFTSKNDIAVYTPSGTRVCDVTPNIAFVSSISAKGGYMVFTDPTDNLVGIAKMDCSGYHTIPVTGQPWAVSMANNGGVPYADVISRDKASANGLPMLTEVNVLTGVTAGTVELTGFTPVSTVRAENAYQGLYQVQASSLSSTVAVLSTSDNSVLIINANTMTITHTVSVPEIPFGIAMQDSADPVVWVAYILASSGEAVTHIGAIDSTTGNYTSGVGECQAGILAGGFVANSNGVYCAMGSTIAAPLVLQP